EQPGLHVNACTIVSQGRKRDPAAALQSMITGIHRRGGVGSQEHGARFRMRQGPTRWLLALTDGRRGPLRRAPAPEGLVGASARDGQPLGSSWTSKYSLVLYGPTTDST